ncbi:hypothetical protein [uncultured Sulfitobacter sp.]|nr:hypothetical protein [uncultured Sulfitobacter sp.]
MRLDFAVLGTPRKPDFRARIIASAADCAGLWLKGGDSPVIAR